MDTEHTLSRGQQTLWLLHAIAPGSAAYNAGGAGLFRPAPDLDVLDRAVRALVQRHEMLRSVFTERDGRPVRVVQDGFEPVLEVRHLNCSDEELNRAAAQASRRPYDLSRTGVFRAVLLRREDDAVLLLGAHHIGSDATSQWLLWRDLLAAYDALSRGDEPAWPALSTGYQDYVAREEDVMASPRGARMRDYWRQVGDGAVAAELPLDRPRPARPTYQGATVSRQLPDRLAQRVRAASVKAQVSPFAHLLGAFQVLLHRYTMQRDFTVVCPASTRRSASADVVGYFVNPLVLRSRFGSATTLADAVSSAAEQLRGGMARVAYPYSEGSYRISVTMVSADRLGEELQQAYDGEVESGGCRVSYYDVPHLEGQCDLSVEITQSAASLTVAFRYDTDLFEVATIERLLGHYLRLVEAAVEEPGALAGRVSMVDAGERQRLLALGGVS